MIVNTQTLALSEKFQNGISPLLFFKVLHFEKVDYSNSQSLFGGMLCRGFLQTPLQIELFGQLQSLFYFKLKNVTKRLIP